MLHIFNITSYHIDMLYNQRNLLIICFSFKLIIIATHLLVSLVIIFFIRTSVWSIYILYSKSVYLSVLGNTILDIQV